MRGWGRREDEGISICILLSMDNQVKIFRSLFFFFFNDLFFNQLINNEFVLSGFYNVYDNFFHSKITITRVRKGEQLVSYTKTFRFQILPFHTKKKAMPCRASSEVADLWPTAEDTH